ncbi:MAG: hypothetical protein HZA52_13385, partial [Planctomycetes bacterium]|nr:hypothetical protein [Planctomycetota bacterium]
LQRAAECFERCLELRPRYALLSYNLACARALGGELESAFEWLARAVEWGFGSRADRVRTAETDADLAALRSDARWAPLLASARESEAATRAFAEQPDVYVPTTAGARPLRLLVLLHDRDSTPSRVLDASWRARADEFGFAIVAPCASLAAAAAPESGMHWLIEPSDLQRRPDLFETRVAVAVRTFSSAHPIDRSRVWIAGVGEGALVAFDLATRAPGLFRGVLVLDGPIHPETPLERARRAASMGLEVRVVLGAASERWRPRGAPAEFESGLAAFFAHCGFADRASVEVAPDAEAFEAAAARAIGELAR